jgi:hypothetical protein
MRGAHSGNHWSRGIGPITVFRPVVLKLHNSAIEFCLKTEALWVIQNISNNKVWTAIVAGSRKNVVIHTEVSGSNLFSAMDTCIIPSWTSFCPKWPEIHHEAVFFRAKCFLMLEFKNRKLGNCFQIILYEFNESKLTITSFSYFTFNAFETLKYAVWLTIWVYHKVHTAAV